MSDPSWLYELRLAVVRDLDFLEEQVKEYRRAILLEGTTTRYGLQDIEHSVKCIRERLDKAKAPTCHWCGRPDAVVGAEDAFPDLAGCNPDCPRDEDGTPLPYLGVPALQPATGHQARPSRKKGGGG